MIPVNEPVIGERELANVTECIRTGWISSAGRFIDAFESGWSSYCDRAHGVAVANGTVALRLAVAALDLQPGDEVIMPTFTIISCAAAVVECGGVPVLVDADPETFGMNVAQVGAKITPRTRAIMPVHLYGHPVDMDPLLALAAEHRLAVIEDAAEAHGAEYLTSFGRSAPTWRRCGSFGDASVFSFYANKLITTGEGGMLVTDSDAMAARTRSLRNLCFQPKRRFYHEELGFNFRLTNLQAAVGVAQLERMPDVLKQKRWMGQAYGERLAGIPGLQIPVTKPWARHVFWMYGLVVDESTGLNAVTFAERLAAQGVETRPFFLGMHEQPVLQQRGLFGGEHYPVAERLARQGLYLPSGVALTPTQLDAVCVAVREVLGA